MCDSAMMQSISLSLKNKESRLFSIDPKPFNFEVHFFDFDGTLIDTLWIMRDGMKIAFRKLTMISRETQFTAVDEEFYKDIVEKDFASKRVIAILHEFIKYCIENINVTIKELDQRLFYQYPKAISADAIAAIRAELEKIHAPYCLLGTAQKTLIAQSVFRLYMGLYVPATEEIISKSLHLNNYIYPGVIKYLKSINHENSFIISGGSLSRVSRVLEKTELGLMFSDKIYCPQGYERLTEGARYKIDTLKNLIKKTNGSRAIFIDDQAHVIEQASNLGISTLGIIHKEQDVERMLVARPSFIITCNFLAFSNRHFL